jgi:L-lactate dehydrogenase complex protein LldE
MMKTHYPELFENDSGWRERAQAFCAKTFELVSFLTDILQCDHVRAEVSGTATYHDACAGLRELGIKTQPRRLLSSVKGLTLTEMRDADVCCGFGGTFCVKYPEISDKMVGDKAADIAATGADTILAGDMGCLLNIAGKLSRIGARTEARHIAEVLAGMANDVPAIGKPAT